MNNETEKLAIILDEGDLEQILGFMHQSRGMHEGYVKEVNGKIYFLKAQLEDNSAIKITETQVIEALRRITEGN